MHVSLSLSLSLLVYVSAPAGDNQRFNEEEGSTDDRVLFTNTTNATTDFTNAFALDMTYRMLYFGLQNKVRGYALQT